MLVKTDDRTAAIMEGIKPHVERVLQSHTRETIASERTRQLLTLQRNERFWQGHHYHYPVVRGRTLDWSSVTGNLVATQGNNRPPKGVYDYVLNYYYGDGLKLVGILGRIPNAKAVADHQNDILSARAQKADSIIRELTRHWDTEVQQFELVLSLFKNSTTFGYTPWVASKKKYGETRVRMIEMRQAMLSPDRFACPQCLTETAVEDTPMEGDYPVCPECGNPTDFLPAEYGEVPELVGEPAFANGSVEFHLTNGYTTSTPFHLKKMEDSPWVNYEYEEHFANLMAAYEEVAKDRKRFESDAGGFGSAASAQGAFTRARAASMQLTSATQNTGLWRYSRDWMKPEMYWMVDDAEIRSILFDNFPEGLKCTSVSGVLIRMESEDFRKVWAACKPTVGEYLYPQALGNNYIRINKLINDGFNIMAQTMEKGIPLHFVDPRVINLNALRDFEASVMEFYPAVPDVSGKIRDAMVSTDPGKMNPVTTVLMEAALAAARQISGITEPLFGGGDKNQTLGEAELRRNQALMPHNTTWAMIRRFWAKCYENAILQFAEHAAGPLHFAATVGARTVDLGDVSELAEGGWHIEVEESIPRTYGQERAQMWQLLQAGPEMWQMLGLNQPNNITAIHDTLGNDRLKVPGMDARNKALSVIQKLLGQQPMMISQAPLILQPSIPIDMFEDDHLLSAQVVREWSQTEEVIRSGGIRDTNPLGYLNVIAWGQAHAEAAAPPPMLAGPDGGPPPPGAPPQPSPVSDLRQPPAEGSPQLRPAPPQPSPEEMGAPVLEGA